MKKNIRYVLPLGIFLVILGLLTILVLENREPLVASNLLNKPMPSFSVSCFNNPGKKLTQDHLKGHLVFLNFFSSSCPYCLLEQPALMQLHHSQKIKLYGVHLKSTEAILENFLRSKGNPYTIIGLDHSLSAARAWGVISTPESFMINKKGIVIFHHRGPLSPQIVTERILPLIEKEAS